MKCIFLILIIEIFSLQFRAQTFYFENIFGQLDSSSSNSIVIVAGDLNCSMCFDKLNEILQSKFIDREIKVRLYYDSKLLPDYGRHAKSIEMKKKLPKVKFEIVFPTKLRDNNMLPGTCPANELPYLLLLTNDQAVVICHKYLFDDKRSPKRARKDILEYFKN